MGLIKFKHNNKTWAIVRNHKCSTTTMLSYVAQALNADPRNNFTVIFRNYAPEYILNADCLEYKQSYLVRIYALHYWRGSILEENLLVGFITQCLRSANRTLGLGRLV